MRERGDMAGGIPGDQELQRISAALHELCQPLTTLQCRLEMAELVHTPDAYRDAVEAGLTECARLAVAVASMRDSVRAAMQQAASAGQGSDGIGAAR